MGAPPVEVYCKPANSKSNEIVVETEVYPDGYGNGITYYINTRWNKGPNGVSFKLIEFGGDGDPGEPMLNGAAVRASAEKIEDALNVQAVDDSSPHPDPDVGYQRIDSSGNKI